QQFQCGVVGQESRRRGVFRRRHDPGGRAWPQCGGSGRAAYVRSGVVVSVLIARIHVTPAKAGVQTGVWSRIEVTWIPAVAGMTLLVAPDDGGRWRSLSMRVGIESVLM